MPASDLIREVGRQMVICNACRYCEGYCAVFPAMELRTKFEKADVLYLANLCHDCRACYYACQYAPPHEFDVNVPKVLSEVRVDTYKEYAWPRVLSGLFEDNRRTVGTIAVAAVVVVLLLMALIGGPSRLLTAHTGPGAFYQIVPYLVLVVPAMVISLYGLAAFAAGAVAFWRDTHSSLADMIDFDAFWQAIKDTLGLHYMRGGGYGCYYPEEKTSDVRRVFHSMVFYGFLVCFVSTTLAAIYQDVLDRMPPYPVTSLPVMLGIVGGAAMIVGTAGLLYLKGRSDREPSAEGMTGMDAAFIIVLGLTSLTGMLVLIFRGTPYLGVLLGIHLGVIAGLYITAPYGKFAHAVYRYAALVRYRLEERRALSSH